jgi:hypothetical protein
MRSDVPPPGRAMAFPEWSAAIVAGVRAYLPDARGAQGLSILVIRHGGLEARLMDDGGFWISFAGGETTGPMSSLVDDRRDAFTVRNLAQIAGWLLRRAVPLKSSFPICEGIVEHLPHAPFATPGSHVAPVPRRHLPSGLQSFRPTRTASKSSAKARGLEQTLRHRNVEKHPKLMSLPLSHHLANSLCNTFDRILVPAVHARRERDTMIAFAAAIDSLRRVAPDETQPHSSPFKRSQSTHRSRPPTHGAAPSDDHRSQHHRLSTRELLLWSHHGNQLCLFHREA